MAVQVYTEDGPDGGGGEVSTSPMGRFIRRYRLAVEVRSRWTGIWDDCIDYGLPQRDRSNMAIDGGAKHDKLYDTTAPTAVGDFASRLQAYVCPIQARWADLKSGPDVPKAQRPQIDRALRDISDVLFEAIESSSFDLQMPECFHELSIGTACVALWPGSPGRPLVFTSVPFTEVALEHDADGMLTAFFRTRSVKHRDIQHVFPNAELDRATYSQYSVDPNKKCTIVEGYIRDTSSLATERWQKQVVLLERRLFIEESVLSGLGSMPYIPFHWTKSPADTYGRGPLMRVIGAVKVLNATQELLLDHAEMQVVGMWQGDSDGMVNVDTMDLFPGAIIPRAPGSTGLEPLIPGGRIEWAQLLITEIRGEIRRALFDEPLGNMQQDARIQTAQEVVERVADLSKRVGSSFGRLDAELIDPVIRRALFILREFGIIKIPTLSSRMVSIRMTSPIGRTQQTEEVVRIQRFNQAVVEMFGPGSANLVLKKGETIDVLADRLGVPKTIVNSAQEIAAAEQQAQQRAMLIEMVKGAGLPEQSPGLV